MSRTPGGLTDGRGRVVLGLGELRACEGVRGRARACEGVFYPYPILLHFAIFYYNLRFESTLYHFYLNSSKILISDFPFLISDSPPQIEYYLGSCDQKIYFRFPFLELCMLF